MSYDLDQWHAIHSQPIMITEYGAGTVAGVHEVCIIPCSQAGSLMLRLCIFFLSLWSGCVATDHGDNICIIALAVDL